MREGIQAGTRTRRDGLVANLYEQSREALDRQSWESTALRNEVADLKKRLAPEGGPHRSTPILLHPKIRGFSAVTLMCECGMIGHVVRVGHKVHVSSTNTSKSYDPWGFADYVSRNSAHPDEEPI